MVNQSYPVKNGQVHPHVESASGEVDPLWDIREHHVVEGWLITTPNRYMIEHNTLSDVGILHTTQPGKQRELYVLRLKNPSTCEAVNKSIYQKGNSHMLCIRHILCTHIAYFWFTR